MDINNLSNSEVVKLILQTKHFLDNPSISIPIFGKYRCDETVQDNVNGIEYKLHAYRGNNIKNKYSIHIRFTDNNIHLVRLCINGLPHINKSDKSKVTGNHLHIYDSNSPDHNYAYDLKKYGNFISTDDLEESFEKFLKFVKISKNN
ncbi:hypothetical protein DS834_02950 [Lactobacillus bombicola]|uniref:Uncharacterized protein n=1 Tax=Lactobacillus bombicola TaxID=1505723 RepID=A0ABX9LVF3_9LACO|nr:hypothetical protein [Lactobacillus bombicola]RHW52859.1 hypothetical protein DS834_02950 [Lactobacillus bombicola]